MAEFQTPILRGSIHPSMPKSKPVPAAPEWAKELTQRERAFVEQYLVDLNASAAMRRCGFVVTGQHPLSAAARGSEMLAKTHVAAAIETLLRERGVTRMWVLDQISAMAHVDVTEFVNADGSLTVQSFDELDPAQRKMIASVEPVFDKDGNRIAVKLTFHNERSRSLEKLAKLLRMEVERTEISGPNGGPLEVSDPAAEIAKQIDLIEKRNEERERRAIESGKVRATPK